MTGERIYYMEGDGAMEDTQMDVAEDATGSRERRRRTLFFPFLPFSNHLPMPPIGWTSQK